MSRISVVQTKRLVSDCMRRNSQFSRNRAVVVCSAREIMPALQTWSIQFTGECKNSNDMSGVWGAEA